VSGSPVDAVGATVDVAVVGAGLAGLQCARELVGAGLDVAVLEAAEAVGGRVRSERVDGFTVDRGFQLLNPAYPAVRRWVDTTALGLQPLPAGVAARLDRGTVRVADPRREPRLLPATLRGALPLLRSAPAAARWGVAQIALAAFLWGTGGLVVQLVRERVPMTVPTISAWRLALALAALVVASGFFRGLWETIPDV